LKLWTLGFIFPWLTGTLNGKQGSQKRVGLKYQDAERVERALHWKWQRTHEKSQTPSFPLLFVAPSLFIPLSL
jgi:hypothetical protein